MKKREKKKKKKKKTRKKNALVFPRSLFDSLSLRFPFGAALSTMADVALQKRLRPLRRTHPAGYFSILAADTKEGERERKGERER